MGMRGHMGAAGPAGASQATAATEAAVPAGAMEGGDLGGGGIKNLGECFDVQH